MVSTLKKSDITCTIPALSYIDIDTSSLDYCNNTEDALAVNGLIYNLAQKVQVLLLFLRILRVNKSETVFGQ